MALLFICAGLKKVFLIFNTGYNNYKVIIVYVLFFSIL